MFINAPAAGHRAQSETGDLIWRYKKELPEDLLQLHPTNRGVALWEDRVFVATVDAHLIALDAKTGTVLWDATVGRLQDRLLLHAPLRSSPRASHGRHFRRRARHRGYIARLRRARRQTGVEDPYDSGPESRDTTPGRARRGRRAALGLAHGAHYDPQLNLTFWGTGNAAPCPGDMHAGDNLYSSSVIALDADTGGSRPHQYHWNDSWDWAESRRRCSSISRKTGASSRGSCTRAATATCGGSSAVRMVSGS